ncbi:hypothetical protein FRC00_001879 [Tulasnella sp. 408]|nr:hypothetical protein FRC00_001879 [Tulasnella sp. 408]
MSRRLSPAVAHDTRYEAAPPAPMFRQQAPSGPTPGATSGEGPDTLLVARSLIRLASEFSPSSLPTPETLEMAASAYQVAMKVHQPNPSISTSARTENPPGQLKVIEDLRKELKTIREETSQAFLRLDEKFEALRGDIASLTSSTWEPKQLQTIEEEVGSHVDTARPGHKPVGSFRVLRGEQTPALPGANKQPVDEDSSESVKTFFKIILNTLTQENYHAASNRMIREMNKSDRKTNAAAVKLVADLVFETAINEARPPDMCARLCQKIMENLSEDIQDDRMRDPAGEILVGGLLFRKYLLIKSQDYFERGWSTQPGPRGAQNFRTSQSKRIEDASKTRSQGLGVMRFLGELFKSQMLNERIMHECIKKLLANVDNPEEEDLESLCTLLTTAGRELETSTAQDHFDIYFGTIRMLADDHKLSTALRRALTDLIELRQRGWRPKNNSAGPAAFPQAREPDASKIVPSTRWGSQRDGRGTAEQGPGGWNGTVYQQLRSSQDHGDEGNPNSDEEQTSPAKSYTEEEAEAKVDEDVKEFFNIRDVSEGEKSFAELPDEHKRKLVHRLAYKALDLKEADVELVAELFERVASKACPPSAFEDGLAGITEYLDDTETDVPQVYTFMAKMLRGSKLSQETVESLADKMYVEGEPEVKPKDKLLKAYEALS